MNTGKLHFYRIIIATLAICGVFVVHQTNAADVVARPSAPAPAKSVNPGAARANNAASRTVAVSATATKSPTTTVTTKPEPQIESVANYVPAPAIENKDSQFGQFLGTAGQGNVDTGASILADKIRAQRAALDAASATSAGTAKSATGANTCDAELRTCMTNQCGKNFTKCAGDGDTAWGNKIDNCRSKSKCTGAEYAALAPEIKADRDMYAQFASYNEIIDCGNEYNSCIVSECGTTFNKCLGKSAGDAAIAKCGAIAKRCISADSGLASRVASVFGTLRQGAEKQISADEKRLYSLRDAMESQCKKLGAMFDQRTLDCVFTVNFYANNSNTPYASQKRYAGDTFDCTQDWFGVDVTTFKENAYRETRAQTSASSAMLGSGIGVAAGAISSGAINRAIDRTKAEKELNDACKDSGMKLNKKTGECEPDEKSGTETGGVQNNNSSTNENKKAARKEKREENKEQRQSEKNGKDCKALILHAATATYNDGKCTLSACKEGYTQQDNKCVIDKATRQSEKENKQRNKEAKATVDAAMQGDKDAQQRLDEAVQTGQDALRKKLQYL